MKLFFEAGTVGAADEHVAAHRTGSRGDAHARTPRQSDLPPASARGAAPPSGERPMALPGEVRIVEAPHDVRVREATPVKPVILEWDEWTAAFQQEPVIIDVPQVPADDGMTTPDLSAVRTVPDVTAEAPPEKSQGKQAKSLQQRLRIPHEVPRSVGGASRATDRSFIDGTKRTL